MERADAPSENWLLQKERRTLNGLTFALTVGILLVAVLGNTDGRPLDEHEIYVARTVTEMARREDWILPYFNGEPRLQKPPMSYWAVLAAAKVTQVDPTARVPAWLARLPSVGSALFLCAIAWYLTRKVSPHPWAPVLSVALLGTSNAFVAWSHSARPEMLYATWNGAGVAAFCAALQSSTTKGRNTWVMTGWLALAAGTLTKGPHYPGFLLIALSLAVLLSERPWRSLGKMLQLWMGLPLWAGICGAYVAALAQRTDNLFDYWWQELFGRTGGFRGTLFAFRFYYVAALLWMAAPWCLLVGWGALWPLRRWQQRDVTHRFLWLSVVVPALFLSVARGQRMYYLLPSLMPAFCLAAVATTEVLGRSSWILGRPVPVAALLRLHVLVSLAFSLFVGGRAWRYFQEGFLPAPFLMLAVVGLMVVVGCLAAAGKMSGKRPVVGTVFLGLGLLMAYAFGVMTGAFWSTDRYLRAAAAQRILMELPADGPLYAIAGRLEHLVYYGDRSVKRISHAEAKQLASRASDPFYLLDEESCWGRCRLPGTVVLSVPDGIGHDQIVILRVDPRLATPASRIRR
jgi:4-amino-4-deoxy-L-arabinose transferase-like glycosyltransferase